jgi:thioredoxin-like negative regulator of GroEL
MVRLTSAPPFLDQLDHAQRQAAAESVNRKRLAMFSVQDSQVCLNSYLAAIARRPDDWPIRFNMAVFCHELKRDEPAVEQFKYLCAVFLISNPSGSASPTRC